MATGSGGGAWRHRHSSDANTTTTTAAPTTAPTVAPTVSAADVSHPPNDDDHSGDPSEVLALLNGTIGSWVTCAVRHALCDISSCTRNDDGVSASCGCIDQPADDANPGTLALGWPSAILSHDTTCVASRRRTAPPWWHRTQRRRSYD